jgi:hypothetical protein
MKQLIIAAVLLTSCVKPSENIRNEKTMENVEVIVNGNGLFYTLGSTEYKSNGMKYKVFQSSNGGVAVVNVTTDSLEVALKRHEIKSYKDFESQENGN